MSTREINADAAISKVLSRHHKLKLQIFIRQLRESLGITRTFMARDIGISHDRLVAIESEKSTRKPKESELIKIANYYGISSQIFLEKCQNLMKPKRKLYELKRRHCKKADCGMSCRRKVI